MYHQTQDLIQEEMMWIQRAKASPQDFGPLYKKYHESIFRYVYQRMDDKEMAYDIVSQVFIKALTNLNRYENKGLPFSSWLFRIAKSEVYQSFRDNKTKRFVNIDTVQINQIIEEFDEEISEVNLKHLCYALKMLKESEIQLLEMRFFEKRSFKEMGEILDFKENNVKVKTFRALEKLKSHFHTK